MLKRYRLAAAVAAFSTATLVSGGAFAESRSLTINGFLPPFHPIMKLTILPWSKEVEKVTEGRVTFTVTPQSVVPPPRQIDAVGSGAVDVAFSLHGYTPGRFQAGQIATLPFLARTGEALSVAFWRTHEKHFVEADEYKGVKLLTLWAGTPGYLYSHTRPVRSMEDWRGLKVFCGLRINCDIIDALGGTPVQRPGPEATQLIERKVVDASLFDPPSYKNFKLDRFVKYATFAPTGFYAPTFFLMINEKVWDSLSEQDRAAIGKLSGEALARKAGADYDEDAAESNRLLEKNDVDVTMAEGAFLEEMKKTLEQVNTRYFEGAEKAGVDGRAALEFLLEQVAAEEK